MLVNILYKSIESGMHFRQHNILRTVSDKDSNQKFFIFLFGIVPNFFKLFCTLF